MIGWETTAGRDAAEAILNGDADGDLGGLEGAIAERRDRLAHPACPSCGEALKVPHTHDGVLVMPAGAASDRNYGELVRTLIDAMLPPKRPQSPPPETPRGPLP